MRDNIELKVHLAFDDEAAVWYIAESDIPGLRLEAADPFELMRRIEQCAGTLIQLNEQEIIADHLRKRNAERPAVTYRPVFDSPLPVAAYA